MRKICKFCETEKSLAEFVKTGISRHSMCDPCRKAYMREQHHKRQALRKAGIMYNA